MRKIRIEPRRWGALLVSCGLLAGVALASSSVLADEGAERAVARQHFAKGVALAKQRHFAEALDEFEQAYAAVPHFRVLYNIGQAQIALGKSAEAVATLQRYLDEAGTSIDAKRRGDVQADIDREREKAPAPTPAAPTPTSPASVEPTSVEPTSVEPVADLTPATSALPVATPAPAGAAASPAGDHASPAAPAKARRSPSASARRGHAHPAKASSAGRRTLAYVVAGAGVALSAAAFIHYSWNRDRYQRWQGEYADYLRDPTARHRVAANDLAESIDNASAVTVVLGIGAGVALGTGTVLWLTSGAPDSDRSQRGPAPFFSAQGTF